MNSLNVTVAPVTCLISPDGSILYMAAGALDAEGYRAILNSFLAEQ